MIKDAPQPARMRTATGGRKRAMMPSRKPPLVLDQSSHFVSSADTETYDGHLVSLAVEFVWILFASDMFCGLLFRLRSDSMGWSIYQSND